ncbi:4'-phosphopantetheinyl transferase family protein [Chitinophaga flava]|uniref:4'-phosphopantetheinyl transferase n=1 Tax=Chitinophaga flava TaxID=2259036 RepID=A0A365XUQ1_9BACT|nr:4'-phosphopantetheinyl transferase family protein [Chitinophaga flava]RBL89848.1 4'-phosphopantetheinyl transferase [Chitinophaga flava]
MNNGRIILKRENNNFNTGFCIIKSDLPDLIKKIPLLHPEEKAYYNTLKFDKRKMSYLLGRIASKKAVCELTEENNMPSVLISTGIFQFPVVKTTRHQNIQVSISHADDIGIALAFPEEHPLGIDLEKVNPDKIDTIKSQLGASEIALITACHLSLPVGCTTIWTIKEGLSKILKTGLMMNFQLLEIQTLEKHGNVYTSTFRHFPQYKAISCLVSDYICSIILPKNTTPELDLLWDAYLNTLQL